MKLFTQIDCRFTKTADDAALPTAVANAAKAAGYTIGPVYHGTEAEFNVFTKTQDIGYHFGNEKQAAYKRGKRTVAAYLRIANPIRLPDHVWDNPKTLADGLATLDTGGRLAAAAAEWEKAKQAEADLDQDLPWDEFKRRHHELQDHRRSLGSEAMRMGQELLRTAKNDGVIYENEVEGNGNSYIVFKSEQIKSADPVTYDDQKNPIPLEKRFDSSNPDIRY